MPDSAGRLLLSDRLAFVEERNVGEAVRIARGRSVGPAPCCWNAFPIISVSTVPILTVGISLKRNARLVSATRWWAWWPRVARFTPTCSARFTTASSRTGRGENLCVAILSFATSTCSASARESGPRSSHLYLPLSTVEADPVMEKVRQWA